MSGSPRTAAYLLDSELNRFSVNQEGDKLESELWLDYYGCHDKFDVLNMFYKALKKMFD